MVYEDWTVGWTEVDTNNDLTVIANTITITSMRQDADGCVYKNYGAGHFGNFTNIEIDNFIDEPVSDDDGTFVIVGMSDNSSYLTWRDMWLNEEGWVVVKYMYGTLGTQASKVALRACDGQVSDDTIYSGVHDTTYLDCRRNGALITVDVYDDAARTILWDTLNVTDPGDTYRYCICGTAYHCVGCGNADHEVTGWVANLDLHEVLPPPAPVELPPMGFGFEMGIGGKLGWPLLGTGGCSIGG